MPRSSISRWKPRFVITVTATTSTSEVQREDREDLVAVDRLAGAVDGEHPVAVAVERDAEVVAALADGLLEQREVGGAATLVDVLAVRFVADRGHLGAELLERLRRDSRSRRRWRSRRRSGGR